MILKLNIFFQEEFLPRKERLLDMLVKKGCCNQHVRAVKSITILTRHLDMEIMNEENVFGFLRNRNVMRRKWLKKTIGPLMKPAQVAVVTNVKIQICLMLDY